jgi:AraC-like DNA-binding protein
MLSKQTPPLPFEGLQIVLGPLDLHADNWRWNRPIPDCFNLWIALEGQAEMKTLEKKYHINPGTAFVFSPHQKISAHSVSPQPFRNFAVRFIPRRGNGDILKKNVNNLMGVTTSNLSRTRELCRAAVQVSMFKDALSVQQASGLCYQLLAQVWRDAHTPIPQDPDLAILRMMERLRDLPSQRPTLKTMAQECRLSVAQFGRRFYALTGETPMNFAIRQRMSHAQNYLQGSSLHIQEIADTLGYSDIYFFSRQFKKFTGISPSDYRKTHPLEIKEFIDSASIPSS